MDRTILTFPPVQHRFSTAVKTFLAGRSNTIKPSFSAVCVEALMGIVLVLYPVSSRAANWYVRPSSAGADSGKDWDNAWSMSSLNSNWSTVQPGDTVWLAGGTYNTGIAFTKSGTSGARIFVKRVLSSDYVPAGTAGWNSGFDSQVVINGALQWPNNDGAGSYVTADGRVTNGIVTHLLGSAGIDISGGGQHDITVANIDSYGSLNASGTTFASDPAAWIAENANNILTQNCSIHGYPTVTKILYGCMNITFEHCRFYDSNASNWSTFHPNLFEINDTPGPVNFHWCEFSNWAVEGFMMWNGVGRVSLIGNVIHDPLPGGASFLWPSGTGESTAGPVVLYNNTFVNVRVTNGQGNSVNFALGTQARNNIYWNSGWAFPTVSDSDHNFSNGSASGVKSISNGSIPFVNLAGKDYHIVSTVGATYPRNKGVELSPDTDPDGNMRGADGAWDIGAYEYPPVPKW
jgi:hypothetical protein